MLPVKGYHIQFENVTIFHGYVITNVACEGYPIHFENVTIFHSYVITNFACGRLSYAL